MLELWAEIGLYLWVELKSARFICEVFPDCCSKSARSIGHAKTSLVEKTKKSDMGQKSIF